jgi:hypothetical protein
MKGKNMHKRFAVWTSTLMLLLITFIFSGGLFLAAADAEAEEATSIPTGFFSNMKGGLPPAMAVMQLDGKAEHIRVDLSDPLETAFIKELSVDVDSREPVVIVMNARGQITGRYAGAFAVEDLTTSATFIPVSGCCPGGSGKSCGPTRQ